jgi:hypothetical protein
VEGFCIGGLVLISNLEAGFVAGDLVDVFFVNSGIDFGVGRMLIDCGVRGITGVDVGSGFECSCSANTGAFFGTGGRSSCGKGSGPERVTSTTPVCSSDGAGAEIKWLDVVFSRAVLSLKRTTINQEVLELGRAVECHFREI